MKPVLSKPLLALLLATAVLSIIALLQPETAVTDADALLADPHPAAAARTAPAAAHPWVRALLPEAGTVTAHGFAVAPPPPPKPVAVPVVVAPPPKPVAPAPAFTYLGRMVRDDGSTLVFLGKGDDTLVVALGAMVDASWRLEGVDAKGIRLLYVPLNETRQLAMNGK